MSWAELSPYLIFTFSFIWCRMLLFACEAWSGARMGSLLMNATSWLRGAAWLGAVDSSSRITHHQDSKLLGK